MAITLDFGSGDVLTLPPDLSWSSYLGTTRWGQDQARTLSGALVAESWPGSGGAIITLESGPTWGWATTSLVEDLRTRFEAADSPMTLTIGDTDYTVMLDRYRGGFSATARKRRPAESRPDDDVWFITLAFFTIEE